MPQKKADKRRIGSLRMMVFDGQSHAWAHLYSHNSIDNPIDNGRIGILQPFHIQSFTIFRFQLMIDKPSKGLDKRFFVSGIVLLLPCKPKGMFAGLSQKGSRRLYGKYL